MNVTLRTEHLHFQTQGEGHMIDVTAKISQLIEKHGLEEGHVLLFVPGATGALTTIEYEPGLIKDFPAFFDKVIPRDAHYHHEDTWHDGNGHSHVRASLLGPSLTVPVEQGELTLGTWQQIILVDFDNHPRQRRLVAQLFGLLHNKG